MIFALRSATISRMADVEIDEREEAPIAQPGEHVALDDQHGALDLRLVPRLARSCRQDRGVVVLGELLVCPVDARLVAARGGDSGLQVVAHDRLRNAADGPQCIDMRSDPIGQPLRPARLCEGVVGGAQHRDEDLDPSLLAGPAVEHRHRVAGEVHEQLVRRPVALAHRRRDGLAPSAVEIAEPTVAVTVSVLAAVLLPKQQQRHAAALELLVDLVPIGQRLFRMPVECGRREQSALQLGIVQRCRHRPGNADDGRAPQILADRRAADADRDRDLSLARAKRVLQPQDFSNFPHRRSLERHRTSPCVAAKEVSSGDSVADRESVSTTLHRVAGFDRNGWPAWLGISGLLASESVAGLARITHSNARSSMKGGSLCMP